MRAFVEMPGEVWTEAVMSEEHEVAFRLALRSDIAATVGEPKEAILIPGELRSPAADSSVELVLDVVTETCNRNDMVRQVLTRKAQDDLLALGETTRLLAMLLPSLAGNEEKWINADLYLSKGRICKNEKCKDLLSGRKGSRKAFKERFRHATSLSLANHGVKVQDSDIVVTSLRTMQEDAIYVEFHALRGGNKSALADFQKALLKAMEDPNSELQKSMAVVANRSSVSVSSALRDLRPPRLVVDQTYKGAPVAEGVTAFGPDGCVSVYQGKRGTCVIRTMECNAKQISQYKVMFQCNGAGGKKGRTHSFNEGAFATDETYDTGVWCDVCSGPPEIKSGSFESGLTAVPFAIAVSLLVSLVFCSESI
jgi:hypothetical protein